MLEFNAHRLLPPIHACLALAALIAAPRVATADPLQIWPSTGEAGCVTVVVHESNPIDSIRATDLSSVFLKKTKQWSTLVDGLDAAIVPIDLEEASPVRNTFTHAVHGRALKAVQGYWQRVIFAGRDVPPDEAGSGDEVLRIVRNDPHGVGYVPCDALPADGVRALPVIGLREVQGVVVGFDDTTDSVWRPDQPSTARTSARDETRADAAAETRTGPEVPPAQAERREGQQEEMMVLRAFVLDHADAMDAMLTVRREVHLHHMAVLPERSMLLVRDRLSKVDTAARIVRRLDVPRDEVRVDARWVLLAPRAVDQLAPGPGQAEDGLTVAWQRLTPAAHRQLAPSVVHSRLVPSLRVLDRDRGTLQVIRRFADGDGAPVGRGLTLELRPEVLGTDVSMDVSIGATASPWRDPSSRHLPGGAGAPPTLTPGDSLRQQTLTRLRERLDALEDAGGAEATAATKAEGETEDEAEGEPLGDPGGGIEETTAGAETGADDETARGTDTGETRAGHEAHRGSVRLARGEALLVTLSGLDPAAHEHLVESLFGEVPDTDEPPHLAVWLRPQVMR